MNKSTSSRRGRTCVFLMHVHLVFVAKYRRNVFTKEILEHMCVIFSDVCKDFESNLSEFNGEGDYVHLLINYPPKISISKLVNSLKGVSSRLQEKTWISNHTKKIMGRSPLVSKLLCLKLWRSFIRCFEKIYLRTNNTLLNALHPSAKALGFSAW
jgi:putative transposase